eukprot:SM000106S13983  [mRNA]  locus=s106:431518:439210:+ [translate_table: standard]
MPRGWRPRVARRVLGPWALVALLAFGGTVQYLDSRAAPALPGEGGVGDVGNEAGSTTRHLRRISRQTQMHDRGSGSALQRPPPQAEGPPAGGREAILSAALDGGGGGGGGDRGSFLTYDALEEEAAVTAAMEVTWEEDDDEADITAELKAQRARRAAAVAGGAVPGPPSFQAAVDALDEDERQEVLQGLRMADARRAGVKLRLHDTGNSNVHEDRPQRRGGGARGDGKYGGGDVSSEAWDEQLAEEEALRLTEVPDPPGYRTFQQEEVQAVADGARLLSELERLDALALSLPTDPWQPPPLLAARLAETRRNGCPSADAAQPVVEEPVPTGPHEQALAVPCGLDIGASVTIIATPVAAALGSIAYSGNRRRPRRRWRKGVPRSSGATGAAASSFYIMLVGGATGVMASAPRAVYYLGVRLDGDALSGGMPVLVQALDHGGGRWGALERCPEEDPLLAVRGWRLVDGRPRCSLQQPPPPPPTRLPLKGVPAELLDDYLTEDNRTTASSHVHAAAAFPFKVGRRFAATLTVDEAGFHLLVDGRELVAFEFKKELKPGQVHYVVIGGALRIDLVVPTVQPLARAWQGAQRRDGLPEALPGLALESLWQPPLTAGAELFVGVASMPEHLDLRDAARRTWMLDPLVHQGRVAVRFFVALHASARVNLEVRKEMELFGDVELLPHLDTYHLITKKTVAICTFAVYNTSAKYVMKMDDDSIIRVTEILLRVKNIHQGGSLLYGHLEAKFKPIRNKDKWWVSREEWPKDKYKFTWAHGPGYIFSRDIATYVCDRAHSGKLRLKKSIEDVVFASWLLDYPKPVQFVNSDRFVVEGCRVFYLLAHYLSSDQMLCMWKKVASGEGPLCCDNINTR